MTIAGVPNAAGGVWWVAARPIIAKRIEGPWMILRYNGKRFGMIGIQSVAQILRLLEFVCLGHNYAVEMAVSL